MQGNPPPPAPVTRAPWCQGPAPVLPHPSRPPVVASLPETGNPRTYSSGLYCSDEGLVALKHGVYLACFVFIFVMESSQP